MIQTKYLIMIGAVICLLILYYIYSEILNVKKLFVPAYQKTMSLEAKILELEKRTLELLPKKKPINPKIDSPALSITYHSDMVKNGNLSVKYTDLSDTEANELLRYIEQNKPKTQQTAYFNRNHQNINQQLTQPQQQTQSQPQPLQSKSQLLSQQNVEKQSVVQNDDLTDFNSVLEHTGDKNIENEPYEETDTFNIKIDDLINKNSLGFMNTNNEKSDTAEYQKILKGLTSGNRIIYSEDIFDNNTELDQDIIKSISESIQFADIPSENTLSDIPDIKTKKTVTKKNSKKTMTSKNNKSKNNSKKM